MADGNPASGARLEPRARRAAAPCVLVSARTQARLRSSPWPEMVPKKVITLAAAGRSCMFAIGPARGNRRRIPALAVFPGERAPILL